MKIFSWNVNSLRNAESSFIEFISKHQPDLIFIQELRANEDQISFFLKLIPGYQVLFNPSGKPGYSGTAIYYKDDLPITDISTESKYKLLEMEGRLISCKVKDIEIYGFYIPNGSNNTDRYIMKLEYHRSILELAQDNYWNKIPTILLGDLNVAHTEIDLYSPKTSNHSGFFKEERDWFSDVLDIGYIDALREFHKESGLYTWWHLRDPERKMNKGWRFDYFIVSDLIKERIVDSEILKDVFGSDHCPISLEIID